MIELGHQGVGAPLKLVPGETCLVHVARIASVVQLVAFHEGSIKNLKIVNTEGI